MNPTQPVPFLVPLESAGDRLDVFLARQLPDVSRSQIARAISEGGAKVGGKIRKASHRLQAGDLILFDGVAPTAPGPQPEAIELDVLFEDEEMVVINKPTGMVVHPAKGHWQGTLASALAGRYQSLSDVGGENRPGIVHRLDRDTSGVIVVARTNRAHLELSRQFADREVKKTYIAFTRGEPNYDRDWIDQPIGPHPKYREKMAIAPDHPERREARTFFEIMERYKGFAQLRLEPETGRTHQIRVHLAHVGTPVLCDPLYGDPRPLTAAELVRDSRDDSSPIVLARLALHAFRLKLRHPILGTELEFSAPLPPVLTELANLLATRRQRGSR